MTHRQAEPAFCPTGKQEILREHPAVFALWRSSKNGRSRLLCLHNVSNSLLEVSIPLPSAITNLHDLVGDEWFEIGNGRSLTVTLHPYQVMWLKAAS